MEEEKGKLRRARYWQYGLLAVILLVAVYFRFHLIKSVPGGLFPDEAANGLDINNIFKGHILPFFARGNGREALFFYFEAASVWLFGRGFWQHHIVSATIGVISVLGCYLMASRFYNRNVGLLASFFMAVGTWHIVLSRTALRAIQIPMFVSFLFYFAARALQAKGKTERYVCAILAGVMFGGGFYTYIAYRIMVVILGFLLAVILLVDWKHHWAWVKEYWRAACAAAVAAFVVFIPLGWYFIANPGSFVGRSSQVSVFNTDLNHGHLLATIASVCFRQLRAFFIDGDTNWRQNISGYPMLSPIISPFFGVAMVALTVIALIVVYKALVHKIKPHELVKDLPHIAVIATFWGMLIPVIATAEGIPHGLRSIGTIPAVYIIAAVGVAYSWKKMMELPHHKWMEWVYWFMAAAFMFSLAFVSYQQYFVYATNVPMVNPGDSVDAFRSDLSTASTWLNEHPDKQHTYLVVDLYSVQTVDYLTTTSGNPYIVVDPAHAQALHVSAGDTVVFAGSTVPDAERFLKAHMHNVEITQQTYDRFGYVQIVVVKVNTGDPSASLGTNSDGSFTALNFGDRIDWSWKNVSFDPWTIKIWQCSTPLASKCTDAKLIKQNNQNDYLSTSDYEMYDGTQSNTYYMAKAFAADGTLLKDYGTITVGRYVNK